jgi:sarcosine oxidase
VYDVIVAGLGGMGSAVLAHCALRGARVLGLEQYRAAHDRGASTGKTRIIRQAYYEDPAYVPLLLRAYDLWRELERRTGADLLHITGLLMAGAQASEVIAGSTRAAREYDLRVDYLTAGDIRARFPSLRVLADEVGVFEHEGGVVFPERAVRAHLDLAERFGAHTRFGVSLRTWQSDGESVGVTLADGATLEARALVLALGPWFSQVFERLGIPLAVQRNVQVWFAPRSSVYGAASFPAFLLERASLPAPLYGFPDFGEGVKAAFHGYGEVTSPGELVREIDRRRDVEPVARALDEWMPEAAGEYREAKACMYALTSDRHFVVDRHPVHGNVVLCGGFSGHGFKFAPVIGEIGADLALERATRHDIGFLGARRFPA